ncbi:MAG: penicillin acylase family protein [Sneathiella sp.]|nr:penicillin acylase family protein [Sneathiella sp.]
MNNFSWKRVFVTFSASLAVLSSIPVANADVSVTRDKLGVPFIETTTNKEMWFAFGYVQARDRLIQIEILRQNAFGELPELKGDGANENAKRLERNAKQRHKYPNLRSTLVGEIQKIRDAAGITAMHCMALGINQFKAEISLAAPQDNLSCLDPAPKSMNFGNTGEHQISEAEIAFIKGKNKVLQLNDTPWTPVDIAGLFHLQVMDEFSNRNTEMNNLVHLLELSHVYGDDTDTAVKVVNSMKWALDKDAATTIPSQPHQLMSAEWWANRYHSQLINSVSPQTNNFNGCTIYNQGTFKPSYDDAKKYAMHEQNDLFPLQASNWWVISQPYSGNGIPTGVMYNGPQIAALDPSRTYQVALKSKEGFQFTGSTYAGTINFWQGHNGNLAMGLTAGNIDVSDIFCVDLYKDGDELYYTHQKGRTSLTAAQYPLIDPDKGPKQITLFNVARSDWPVIMIDQNPTPKPGGPIGTAYIQRYNWEGTTLSTLISWMNSLNATNLNSWNEHLDTVGANFNLIALAANGKASYRLTGSLPIKRGMRPPRNQVPATEWSYYPSYDPRLPAAIAPEDGWNIVGKYYHGLRHDIDNTILVNWNQKPFTNMPDGDLDYDAYFRFDRVSLIKNMLKQAKLEKRWTLRDVLNLNGALQRLDVNYFAYKPFWDRLSKIELSDERKQALLLIKNWGGQRGAYKNEEIDRLGAHYGHVLFYEWVNALTSNFANIIANGNKKLTEHLENGLLKPKQPYLPRLSKDGSVKPRPTVLTSHGVHVNSRIILNAFHSAFEVSLSETEVDAPQTTGYQYTYDKYQDNLLRRINPELSPEANAITMMVHALDTAIKNTKLYPGYSDKQFVSAEKPFMVEGVRTYSGMSSTLGRNDVSIGFRPGAISIPHFRNRGPFNIGVQFLNGQAQGKNITVPGIREFRNVAGAGSPNARGSDFSYNQLELYRNNEYRDMHPLPHRLLIKSKL